MVSQAVIIGASSAGGTFILLCVAVLVYCHCRRKYVKLSRRKDVLKRKKPVTPAPDYSTRPVLANEDEVDDSDQYPPGRAPSRRQDSSRKLVAQDSITLPAVTGRTSTPQLNATRGLRHSSGEVGSAEEPGGEGNSPVLPPSHLRGQRLSSMSLASLGDKRLSSAAEYDPIHGPSKRPSALLDESELERSVSTALDSYKEQDQHHLGKLQVKLGYNFSSRSVRVHLMCACNLPAMDVTGTSDPYVEVLLVDTAAVTTTGKVPHGSPSWQSRRREKTLNPVFEEFHDFPCPTNTPRQRLGLLFYIYDYDRLSRNELIGHVWMTLRDVDLSTSPVMWRTIQPGKRIGSEEAGIPLGELTVALSYTANVRTLLVVVRHAKSLPRSSASRPPDPLVKVRLIHDGIRIASKDTNAQKNSHSPTFNETCPFTLGEGVAPEDCILSLGIWHHDIVHPVPLGVVTLGCTAAIALPESSTEKRHWKAMLAKNATVVEMSHVVMPYTTAVQYKKKRLTKLKNR